MAEQRGERRKYCICRFVKAATMTSTASPSPPHPSLPSPSPLCLLSVRSDLSHWLRSQLAGTQFKLQEYRQIHIHANQSHSYQEGGETTNEQAAASSLSAAASSSVVSFPLSSSSSPHLRIPRYVPAGTEECFAMIHQNNCYIQVSHGTARSIETVRRLSVPVVSLILLLLTLFALR